MIADEDRLEKGMADYEFYGTKSVSWNLLLSIASWPDTLAGRIAAVAELVSLGIRSSVHFDVCRQTSIWAVDT